MRSTDLDVIAACFIGGPASGREEALQGDPHTVRFPVAPEFGPQFWADAQADPSVPIRLRTAFYRRVGVRDDGRRVYAYDARCSDA